MSLGIAYVAVLPTPGVTASPQFESDLIAWCQETEDKLTAHVAAADIDVGTSGDLTKHGNRAFELAAAEAALTDGAAYDSTDDVVLASGGGQIGVFGLRVQPGQRLKVVTVYGQNHGSAWSLVVNKKSKVTGAVTQLGSVSSGTVSGTIEPKTLTFTDVALDNYCYFARWTSGANTDKCYGCRYEVDRP